MDTKPYMQDRAAEEFFSRLERGEFHRVELHWLEELRGLFDRGGPLSRFDTRMPQSLWSRVSRESEACDMSTCAFASHCAFQLARRRWQQADVLILNHYLFFPNVNSGRTYLPAADVVVFDEAHTLEDAATEHYTLEISGERLERLVLSLWNPGTEEGTLAAARAALATFAKPQGAALALVDGMCATCNRLLSSSSSLGTLLDALAQRLAHDGPGRTRLRAEHLGDGLARPTATRQFGVEHREAAGDDLAGLRTQVAAAPDGLLDLRRQLSRLGAPRTRSRWMNKGLGRQPIVVAGPRQDSGHRKAWYCMGIQYCTSPAELPRGR